MSDSDFFLGNTGELSSENLVNYFKKFGTCSVDVKYYDLPKTMSRHFAYLRFESPPTEKLEGYHQIGSDNVRVAKAVHRSDERNLNECGKRIFVGNIHGMLTQKEIEDYFSQFGEVELVHWMKTCCFVTFTALESGQTALRERDHKVGDVTLNVRLPDQRKPKQTREDGFIHRSNGRIPAYQSSFHKNEGLFNFSNSRELYQLEMHPDSHRTWERSVERWDERNVPLSEGNRTRPSFGSTYNHDWNYQHGEYVKGPDANWIEPFGIRHPGPYNAGDAGGDTILYQQQRYHPSLTPSMSSQGHHAFHSDSSFPSQPNQHLRSSYNMQLYDNVALSARYHPNPWSHPLSHHHHHQQCDCPANNNFMNNNFSKNSRNVKDGPVLDNNTNNNSISERRHSSIYYNTNVPTGIAQNGPQFNQRIQSGNHFDYQPRFQRKNIEAPVSRFSHEHNNTNHERNRNNNQYNGEQLPMVSMDPYNSRQLHQPHSTSISHYSGYRSFNSNCHNKSIDDYYNRVNQPSNIFPSINPLCSNSSDTNHDNATTTTIPAYKVSKTNLSSDFHSEQKNCENDITSNDYNKTVVNVASPRQIDFSSDSFLKKNNDRETDGMMHHHSVHNKNSDNESSITPIILTPATSANSC